MGYKKLLYIHTDTFLMLPNLQHIYSYSNRGLQIPTDCNFNNSHSLSQLDTRISNCNVSSLSGETFANVSALKKLDMTYNNLRTVDTKIWRALPKLSTF